MKNAPKHQKRSTTANAGTTLSFSKNSVVMIICRVLNGAVDAFTCAAIDNHLKQSTQAEMVGYWPSVENQVYLNHLIGQYYVANA